MKKNVFIGLLFVFILASQAHAIVFNEIFDAGDKLETAQLLNGGVTEIRGAIGFYGDFDIYQFYFDSAITVDFSTEKPGTWFDEDYTLFNVNGNPLLTSDPGSFSYYFMPGYYYLGLADWDVAARDVNNITIADDFGDILNPDGIFDHFYITSSPYRLGEYVITLSNATSNVPVPEPATMLLFGIGLLAFVGTKKRKK